MGFIMNTKKQALIIVGISGSGKSTIANDFVESMEILNYPVAHIERDKIRRNILNEKGIDIFSKNMWSNWKWEWESIVTQRWENELNDAISIGKSICISDTNLNKDRVMSLVNRLESNGYEVKVEVNDVNLIECIKRDLNRMHSVGEAVLYEQYMKFISSWGVRKQYKQDKTKPSTIIVDIDGTLAHMNGKRGAFEWNKVDVDDIDQYIRFIVNAYYDAGYKIVILSGRDSECRALTEKWLNKHGVKYHELFMRQYKDMRSDYIVKEEMFWKDVAPIYNPVLVIDDRKQVVMNVWHPLGIKVIQAGCAYLDF